MNIRDLKKNDFIIIVIFIIVFLLTRLTNLLTLPIFTDEAIYMRWAQIAASDPSWRFISLIDGKQPMLIWLTLPLIKLTAMPLLSGRLVSVIAGLVGMAGSFFLGWELFKNKRIGYISAFIYLISPFFLWYDRIALYDSLLAAFYVWVLFLEVILARRLRLDIALILGLVLGGAVLTKSSGFFGIYLLPLFLLLSDRREFKSKLLKFIGLSFISVLIAYGLYGVLRLSPWFYIINQKDHEFLYSFSEIIKDPLAHFFGNLNGLGLWWIGYTTIPFIMVLALSLFWRDSKSLKERILLFLLFILPFSALALFGKVLYPRFILFMTVSLIPLYAYAIDKIMTIIKNKILLWVILAAIFIYPLYFDYKIIFDVIDAPLARSERFQFLDDWPSGYGVLQVIDYINQEKAKQPVILVTEGTFGLFPYAFELEYYDDPSVSVVPYWPLPIQDKIMEKSLGKPVFLVLKESQELPQGYRGELVGEYRRGKGNTFLKFYRLTN